MRLRALNTSFRLLTNLSRVTKLIEILSEHPSKLFDSLILHSKFILVVYWLLSRTSILSLRSQKKQVLSTEVFRLFLPCRRYTNCFVRMCMQTRASAAHSSWYLFSLFECQGTSRYSGFLSSSSSCCCSTMTVLTATVVL